MFLDFYFTTKRWKAIEQRVKYATGYTLVLIYQLL